MTTSLPTFHSEPIGVRYQVYAGKNPRTLMRYAHALARKWRASAPSRYAQIRPVQQAYAGNLVVWIALYE